MTIVPTLESERLILRGHRLADFEASAAMWADPAVTRFIAGAPSTRDESWGRMLRYAGLWSMLGFGYWLVEDKETGQLAGEVGFGDFKRDTEPSISGAPEHGWAIAPWAQGKGYATEAVLVTLDWALAQYPGVAPVCMIDQGNAVSERVADKAGYRAFASSSHKGRPVTLYRWQG